MEFILQFMVGNNVRHILRDRCGNIVVHFVLGFLVSIEGGDQQDREDQKEYREDLDDPL